MMEDTSLNEFMEAFTDTADNQIGSEEDTSVDETEATETGNEEQTDAEIQGNSDISENSSDLQDADQQKDAPDDAGKGETFTLKVNKEERTYSREEVIALAQKGADYDRVKDQLTQSRQEVTDLQGKLSGQQAAIEVLEELAKDAGTDLTGLLRNLRLGMFKKQGLSDDAAQERLLRLDAEKENVSLRAAAEESKTEESGSDRAKREIAEFREEYPEVELNQELLDKLMPDVQGGMPLLRAYQKCVLAQKDAEIAELQRQLDAEKQNKSNRAASPGSQKDSGGKRTKSDFDDFMEAFE